MVHRKFCWVEENFGELDYTGKSYWREKIWRISYSQAKYIFSVSVNVGEENFGE